MNYYFLGIFGWVFFLVLKGRKYINNNQYNQYNKRKYSIYFLKLICYNNFKIILVLQYF